MSNDFLTTRNAYIAQTVAGLGLLTFGAVQLGLDMQPPSDVYFDNPEYPNASYPSTPADTYFRDDWPIMLWLFLGALCFTYGSARKAYSTYKATHELQAIDNSRSEGDALAEESDMRPPAAVEEHKSHNLVDTIKASNGDKFIGACIIAITVSICFAIAFGDYERGIENGEHIADYYESHYHYKEPNNPGTKALFGLLYGGAGLLAASAIIPNAWMAKAYHGAKKLFKTS